MPTEGHCDNPMVFRIERGHYGSILLDGLHAALAIHTPGPMGAGNWTVATYVDDAGSAAQREALEMIFGGGAGGPLARLEGAVATRLPTRAVPIRFEAEGRRRSAEIPDVLEITVEGIEGLGGTPTWLDNVRHLVSDRIAIARTIKGLYQDHELDWDNAGRNAHYANFAWEGP